MKTLNNQQIQEYRFKHQLLETFQQHYSSQFTIKTPKNCTKLHRALPNNCNKPKENGQEKQAKSHDSRGIGQQ